MHPDKTDATIINVHHLAKQFKDIVAVQDVSLSVNQGEIFGFLGPNGSGKTTTIRMLCGLLTPDSGSGYCLGYDILRESDAIKRQVGYMPQKFSLYEELTVRENLEFTARIYGLAQPVNAVTSALRKYGLFDRQNQLVKGLSGGWKQRLALVSALIHKPLLLLLDEPTAGVDPRARRDFWDELHLLANEGITTLVSTHYMDEALRCNRLAYLSKGLILIQGTAQTIIEQSNLTTWEVKGKALYRLKQQLSNKVEQVIAYGQNLHVSSHDPQRLQRLAQEYSQQYDWKLIATELEDVFVNLVTKDSS